MRPVSLRLTLCILLENLLLCWQIISSSAFRLSSVNNSGQLFFGLSHVVFKSLHSCIYSNQMDPTEIPSRIKSPVSVFSISDLFSLKTGRWWWQVISTTFLSLSFRLLAVFLSGWSLGQLSSCIFGHLSRWSRSHSRSGPFHHNAQSDNSSGVLPLVQRSTGFWSHLFFCRTSIQVECRYHLF